MGGSGPVESLSAVTLVTGDMGASVRFYEALGFRVLYGGPGSPFTSFEVGSGFLNLQAGAGADGVARWAGWGRIIFWVDDVDAMHARAVAAGAVPSTSPADAPWGERYFHVEDPDGHELSFARPLAR
ncbi:MAG: VOC family protein [Actinomycetota bacterium]|nr:VOC family protein [Actinomycetota bacterium]